MWFTNLDLYKRHQPLLLDTMAHNLKFNKRLRRKLESAYGDATRYPHYDNYDAIEVPFTECIPSDYDGVMGVPITFMDKYNPDQFEIIGMAAGNIRGLAGIPTRTGKDGPYINGKLRYGRIFIRAIRDGATEEVD